MSNLTDHARRELELAGLFSEEGMYGSLLGQAVMELMEVFAGQGHSGMSASIVTDIFSKVAKYEPLTPLTGDESEWGTCASPDQNNRCSHVFRDENGAAYDSQGIIWRDKDGGCFTNRDSHVTVTFPYTPKREYREAPE